MGSKLRLEESSEGLQEQLSMSLKKESLIAHSEKDQGQTEDLPGSEPNLELIEEIFSFFQAQTPLAMQERPAPNNANKVSADVAKRIDMINNLPTPKLKLTRRLIIHAQEVYAELT